MTSAALRPRGVLLSTLALALVVVSPGCAVGRYFGYRGMDLTDIFDVKYGTSIGLGAKVELTQFIGAGGGLSALGVQREWFGRRSIESRGFAFLWAGIVGIDGGYGLPNPTGWSDETADVYLLCVNGTALADFMAAPGGTAEFDMFNRSVPGRADERELERERDVPPWPPTPPLAERWRFGFELLLPGGNFGLYLNLGELADFIIGWTTIDIMDDDGVSKGALYELPPRTPVESELVY